MAQFDQHGVRFRVPDEWTLSEDVDDAGDRRTLVVQSPGSTFWALSLLPAGTAADEAVEAVIAAYRDEYPSLDVYTLSARLGRLPAEARDLDFLTLDSVVNVQIRAVEAATFTALLLVQAADPELAHFQADLTQLSDSLEWTVPAGS
jgi:NAD(P)-dependent dehydrogenase (short-subunit alcohol dehydrogenase family)